jgi:putative ABC transport system permease protein
MFGNYFKLAFRNLGKRKGYALLNILGLAIGITCCLLIFQYVSFERSYDKFPEQAGNIVRLRLDAYQQNKLSWQSATVYPGIGPAMKRDYPEVEDFCRLIDANLLLSNDEKNVKFTEEKGYYADPSFLRMFNVRLVKGNAEKALEGPDKLMLSETMARKYFGSDEAMGKKLVLRDPAYTRIFEVTGIFKDYPANSHLQINHLASYATLTAINRFYGDTSNATETSFGWYDFYTYLQLKPATDRKKFESKFPAFCDKYMNSQEWARNNNFKNELYLLPLTDIHLYSNYNQEAEVNGNGRAVGFIYLIGFLIMAIAWINYINLATARSVERAREVGVRKVMGALRIDLIKQFLLESLLLNGIALAIAFCAAYLLTPSFNHLIGKTTGSGMYMLPQYWLLFVSIFTAGTLLSGLYPAFILSGYQPVKVLKGLFKNTSGGLILRKGLIILQFSASVILIAGTIVVFQQVNFMRKQELGVNIKQTLVLDGAASIQDSLYANSFQPFKAALLKQAGIKAVTASTSVMGKEIYWTSGVTRLDPPGQTAITLYHLGIDYDFIPSFEMKMAAGRNFSKEFSTDNKAAILNETAVAKLGFQDPEKAINEKLVRGRDTLHIIGVARNFHHEGLRKNIEPQLILLRPDTRNAYSIKIESADMAKTVAAAKATWSQYFPNDPFNYYFLDEMYDQQYKTDTLYGKVFGIFASLAILIACFGLLGLSAYNILQRTKEIGIRKVMGASVQNVVFILSKDFLMLVMVAFVLAIPVTWWLMHNWLQDFAYRIDIKWWVFGIAGLLALMIAVATISFQAIKAAIANPVKSLRTE